MKILSLVTHPHVVPNMSVSRSFIKLRFNHRYHMDYFNNVLTAFLDLESGSFVAIYGGSESSQITKVLWVWNDMKVSNLWQNFHFWVNYPFKLSILHQLTSDYLPNTVASKYIYLFTIVNLYSHSSLHSCTVITSEKKQVTVLIAAKFERESKAQQCPLNSSERMV